MPDTPQEIANFLRVYKNSFDPAAIGDFLGEEELLHMKKTGGRFDFGIHVRFHL
jgi:hypothetical protein